MRPLICVGGAAALVAVSACKGRDEAQPPPAPQAATGVASRAPAPAPAAVELDDDGDGGGGDGGGGRKWRDAAVYLDGAPIGVLWFGELPHTLEPVWVDDVQMVDFKPGDTGPHTKAVKLRRYRLRDYLRAAGVPIDRIKMVHVHGPRQFVAAIAGPDLRAAGDRLFFGFGRETAGKPLIYFPPELATNTTFDHIAAVSVYVEKPAPAISPSGELSLDGKPVDGIPYAGQPQRGGIRVYRDDRLATWIKRKLLDSGQPLPRGVTERVDGELRWRLVPYLESVGVDIAGVRRAEVVHDEQRVRTLTRAQLDAEYFTAEAQARGQLLLGAGKQPLQALMLYTRE